MFYGDEGWGGGRNVSKMGEFDKKEVEINR